MEPPDIIYRHPDPAPEPDPAGITLHRQHGPPIVMTELVQSRTIMFTDAEGYLVRAYSEPEPCDRE